MIQVDHVYKSIRGHLVLADINLQVQHGERVVLLGPNGAGKTTLLKILCGLAPFDSGDVAVDERAVGKEKPHRLPVSMALPLFRHMRVRQNLRYKLGLLGLSKDAIEERITETLSLVGFDTALLERYPTELSDGQRQRAVLAMMLIYRKEKPVLLFDEPLRHLDTIGKERAEAELKALFDTFASTVLYVTHDRREAAFVAGTKGRFIVMSGPPGQIAQVGTLRELITQPANDFVHQFFTDWAAREVAFAKQLEHPGGTL